MKKLLLFLFALVILIPATFGQNSHTQKIADKDTWVVIERSDVVDAASSSVTQIFDLTKKADIYFYTMAMEYIGADVSALTTVPVINTYLKFSIDGENFSNLDTLTYYATADTVLNIVENSTAVGYPYLGLFTIGADSATARLTKVSVKFIK